MDLDKYRIRLGLILLQVGYVEKRVNIDDWVLEMDYWTWLKKTYDLGVRNYHRKKFSFSLY